MEFASRLALPVGEIYRAAAQWAIARIHPNRSTTTVRGEVEVMGKRGVHSGDGGPGRAKERERAECFFQYGNVCVKAGMTTMETEKESLMDVR